MIFFDWSLITDHRSKMSHNPNHQWSPLTSIIILQFTIQLISIEATKWTNFYWWVLFGMMMMFPVQLLLFIYPRFHTTRIKIPIKMMAQFLFIFFFFRACDRVTETIKEIQTETQTIDALGIFQLHLLHLLLLLYGNGKIS